jgi:hypothetical protein
MEDQPESLTEPQEPTIEDRAAAELHDFAMELTTISAEVAAHLNSSEEARKAIRNLVVFEKDEFPAPNRVGWLDNMVGNPTLIALMQESAKPRVWSRGSKDPYSGGRHTKGSPGGRSFGAHK